MCYEIIKFIAQITNFILNVWLFHQNLHNFWFYFVFIVFAENLYWNYKIRRETWQTHNQSIRYFVIFFLLVS